MDKHFLIYLKAKKENKHLAKWEVHSQILEKRDLEMYKEYIRS